MLDEALIEQLNRGYVCPPEAGPAWRAACDYGFDMSLVEDALAYDSGTENRGAPTRFEPMCLRSKPHGN